MVSDQTRLVPHLVLASGTVCPSAPSIHNRCMHHDLWVVSSNNSSEGKRQM